MVFGVVAIARHRHRCRVVSNRLVSTSMPKRSELQRQKQEYLQSQHVPRYVAVKKRLEKRFRIKGDTEKESFIIDELFGRYHEGKFLLFDFKKPVISRLEWFNKYPHYRKGYTPEYLRNLNESVEEAIKNDDLYNNLASYSSGESLVTITMNQMEVLDKITEKSPMDALIIANHFSCEDVIANYYPRHEVVEGDVIVPCVHEILAENNGLQFTSKIETFGENIVINGTKSYVAGANRATHFLTFVGTIVKDRDDKLYKRTTAALVPAESEGVDIIPFENESVETNEKYVELYHVRFEDVEIEPEWIVGDVGYAKIYLDHLLVTF